MTYKNCIVKNTASIMEALQVIDCGLMQIALVVDDDDVLVGVVSDGDIRRAILNKMDMTGSVSDIMTKNPVVVSPSQSRQVIKNLMQKKVIHQIPVVDDQGRVVDIVSFTDVIQDTKKNNKIVIMAGGLGSRLKELTVNRPKPLLKIANKPILETIIESFSEQGFYDFAIAVNYKAQQIEDYFKDGSHLGVQIEYIRESKRLGTAGALSLLSYSGNEPIIVMNGDLLTKVNFVDMISSHLSAQCDATMAVREHFETIPFGVIEVDGNAITSVVEKPNYSYLVNAGIYVLNPKVLKDIPIDTYYEMTQLFAKLIEAGRKTQVYPVDNYWLDIGVAKDYQKAKEDFELYFSKGE